MLMFATTCCIGLVVSGTAVIFLANPIYSVLALVSLFLMASLILFVLEVEFLALFFLIIYLGAIAVLFLFVIMMMDIKQSQHKIDKHHYPFGVLLSLFILPFLIKTLKLVFVLDSPPAINDRLQAPFYYNWYLSLENITDAQIFGQIFYTNHGIQILLVGVILYVSAIGVSFLSLNNFKNNAIKTQSIEKQLSRSFHI